MTQPTPYNPSTLFEEVTPGILGPDLDTEFNNLDTTIDEICANIRLIQRDDTQLSNGIVHADSLGADTIFLMAGQTASTRYIPRGSWVTATAYAATDIVQNGSSIYLAVTAHTSASMFATDLAAGKWILIVTDMGGGAVPSGSIVTLNSVSALRATSQSPDLIQLTGYYAKDDGGGGLFYWDSASTTTDDNGYVLKQTAITTGRYKRLPIDNTVNVRYFGGIEGQTTAVQTVALASAIAYVQANSPNVTTIRASGTFTFDPTLLNYQTDSGVQKNHINSVTPFVTLHVGGTITFTTPFYHPQGWSVLGVGGDSSGAAFQTGAKCRVVGDYVCRAYSPLFEDLSITGQLFLDGHGTGFDAYVAFNRIIVSLPAARATAGEAALYIKNKYEISAHDISVFANGTNSTDPTTCIKIESDFETGITNFDVLSLGGGNVVINTVANTQSDFGFTFRKVTSEALNQSALFNIAMNASIGGIIEIDKALIADPITTSPKLYNISSGAVRCLKITQCVPANGLNSNKVRFLETDGLGVFYEYGTVDDDLTDWRTTQRRMSGDFTTSMSSEIGHSVLPGYIKPTFKCLANAPSGWTTVGAAGFDGISNGYTKAVTVGAQPQFIPQSVTTPATASGDVVIVGAWVKRLDQVNTTPSLQLQLLNTIGGVPATDTFSGITTASGAIPIGRLAGYTWYYCYAAFKLSVVGTFNVLAYFISIGTAGTMTVSDVSVNYATGNLTAWEAHELAMANMRYPSLITAGTPPTNYYSWSPGSYHALAADVALGSPVANVVALLPGNTLKTGLNVTGSRPSASAVGQGAQFYDTTLGIPIWSTGSVWKNAAGTTV